MEGSTLNKDQKIAGSAAALFDDSSSPFDAFFASDTFQTSTQQDNQSAASFFDSLANEQPSQTHQTTKDYSSYYEYNRNSSTIQENTYNTIPTTTGAQHYNSTTGYDYNNYYGGQYVSANTNGVTEGMNSSIDPQSTVAQYQYSDYEYNYDASYINGQVYSQYNYSQQQQYYDPNDPYAYYYYHDPAYSQNHAQSSINVEQQNSFQGLPDQANSNQYEEQKEDKSTYNESKQYADDVLRPNAEPGDAPLESSITDVNNFNIDNKNQEFFSDSGKEEREGGEERDSDKENKVMSREIEYSTKKKSIDIVQEQLTITSSNNATSVNNEDAAAVALVETIETNQESVTLTSSKVENDSFIEKDDKLNVLENEDQEVNIIHGDDHDIFEYQPHELENHLKSELSQVEPFVSSLTDESKITSEISDANDIEEINSNSKEEQTKLDDLDDLVLGSTSKSGTSEVLSYTEFENVANPQERYSISAQDSNSTTLNSSYQYDYSDQDHQYNGQWVSNDVSYQYQENDANRIMGDTTTKSEQVGYKYRGNDTVQTTKKIVNYHYEPATNEKEQPIDQYSNRVSVDNINYQYDSGQMTVENSSAIYQNNYRNSAYVANQSTAVDATIYQGHDTSINTTAEQEQSDYQYQANQTTMDKDATLQENYHYTKHDTNQINSTDQTNYHYQEYETSKLDTKTGTDQSNYQYYQGYQPITASSPQNSPPPMSPSPKRLSLISCSDPQCGGENKATAKFCSDCGKPINITMNSKTPAMDISEVIGNTNPYNNLNAYSSQSLPYSHSQASYSTSSFTSYGNQLTSMNDAQYGTGVVLDTHQLDQQQYYGSDDINDPLGRSKGCRPIVAFGFGGKIYTMFPRTVQRFTSPEHSTPITKSAPGAFTIRVLKDIIPVSDIDDFPGPLLMDNNRGGVKAKKKDVLKFLNDQIHVSENNISSFNEEVEKRKLESILIVWNLFKIMFENEGVLIGSPKVEDLVRKILVPSASKSNNDEANFTVPADTGFDSQIGLSQTPETSSLTYSVSIKSVDKLQEILLEGDRIAAIRHAMNENLWAHALIIASCVNKDLWKEVVTGFIRQDLMGKVETSEPDGRESLRVLYSLFAGQGQNAVKEFLPYNNLLTVAQSPVTAMIPTSHYSPNTNAPYVTSKVTALYTSSSDHSVPLDSLIKWRETIAMILANRAPGDNQAISALGDMLKEYGWIHASHVCYILSPNASIISGFDAPNARFTLLGNDYTQNLPINNFYNWQSLRMTEIYEFGLSLNNNNSGLPHLQAYKLLYAWWLADCGYLNEARRYCESIANIVKVYTKGSPYFHGCFLQKLKDLTQRLLEHGGGTNESSSWLFAKKMPKATLDSLWGSLEGKFNKFVAGDVVDENVRKSSSSNTSETIGPFSHFSSITHPTSEVPSRSVSASDFRTIPNPTVDTRRATTPNAVVQKHLNGNQRRSSTPGVGLVNGGYNDNFSPTISDGQNTMSSVQRESLETSPIDDKNGYYGHFKRQDQQYSSSYGYSSYKQYDNNQQSVTDNGANSNEQQPGYDYTSSSDYSGVEGNKKNQQTMFPYYQPSETTYKNDSAWWNNPNSDSTNIIEDQKADQTQTDDIGEGEGEFISLMDSNFTPFVPAPAPAPATSTTVTSNQNNNWDDDYDDLGLGNNSFSKGKNIQATDSATGTNNNNNETKHDISQTEQKKEEKQDEQKAEEKKGWFERWFGKREGGKAANLGEESSFYYDPVQKRWINKKAGSEPNNTLMPPPPPPQRSKTTSPQPSYSMMSSNPNRQSLPPMDNKNQTGLPNSATPPPPPNKGGRASSASMKRGVRRYVDIMNQPSPN